MADAAFIFSDTLAKFEYGDNHPFKPLRARNTMEQCNRHGLLYSVGVIRPEPQPAPRKELELFHTPEYLDLLQRAGEGDFDLALLAAGIGSPDCPVVRGLYAFNELAVGATLLGIDLVMNGSADRAFNLVGGFHHAGVSHAEGFCYMNDVGIGIAKLIEGGHRVAFVDIDAHHCNGVQDRFYNDDRVLTISLHQLSEGFYPETGRVTEVGVNGGFGYTVNVPLAPKTDDEIYVHTFEQVVPPLLEAYKPDIVIAEIGADTLISDPLTNLRLTSNGYEAVVKRLCEVAPRLMAVGGGGYDVFRTANSWTLAFAAMCDLEPEDDFAGLVGGRMYGSEFGGLRDPEIPTRGDAKIQAEEAANAAVRHIHTTVFPVLEAHAP
jgi:acetoin utilization protein AcuC